MDLAPFIIAGLAALAAGFVNAVAGGGTLITFPVLLALGLNPVAANITNTIALCPGFMGGTFAQRHDIAGMKLPFLRLLPFSIAGGMAGGLLLINTPESSFRALIPYLILLATILFALQDLLKRKILKKSSGKGHIAVRYLVVSVATFLAAAYGGYFGAGLGVILMSLLGLTLNQELKKLNALKQALALSINLTAAVYFSFSGKPLWPFVIVMAAGALCGGAIGGTLANRMKAGIFRWIIVATGLIVSVVYFLK